jgi:hypothetical protein
MGKSKEWMEEQRHHLGTFSTLSKCLSNFTDDDRHQYAKLHKAIAAKMEGVLAQIDTDEAYEK